MRPLAVIGLVLLGLGAMVLALVTLTGKPGSDGPAQIVSPLGPGGRNANAPAAPDAPLSDAGRATIDEPKPSEAPIDTKRTEVVSVVGSFANSLTGVVSDPDGQPVEGAEVVVRIQSTASGGLYQLQQALGAVDANSPGLRFKTGPDGAFRFQSVPPSTSYALRAQHKNFGAKEVFPVNVPPTGERVENVTLSRGFRCNGTVADLSGRPIEGAHMLLDSVIYFGMPNMRSPELLEAQTDRNGYYEFANVDAGTRNLTCIAKGYGTRIEMNLNFGDPTSNGQPLVKDFRLDIGHTIQGRVLSPSRSGVANARIEVFNYDAAACSRGLGISDAAGNFTIPDLSAGEYMLTATAQGFSKETVQRVPVDGAPLEVNLAQQGCVMGRVIDRANKQPLASFACAVRMVNPGSTVYGRPVQANNFSNAKDGAFELCGIEPGTYVVQASAPDYAPTYSASFTVVQGGTASDVVVEISHGGKLMGRLIDSKSGEPIFGAEITTFDNGYIKNPFSDLLGAMMPRNTTQGTVRSDREGRFELAALTAEVYQIEIVHPGHSSLTMKDIRLLDDQETDLGNIQMTHGASLSGTVYGADGAPLPNGQVSVRGNQMGRVYNGRAGADGRYRIENVPEGLYTVSATRDNTANDPFGMILDMKKSETTISLAEGGDHTLDLYLGKN